MENAPTGSMVILAMDVILLVTCAVIHITATCLHKYEGAKLAQRYMIEDITGRRDNKRFIIFFIQSFVHESKNDSFAGSDTAQKDYGPIVCFIANSIIIIGVFIALYYVHIYFKTKQSFWLMIVLFFGNQGVVIPMIIIYKYASFRAYLKRQIELIKDVMSCFRLPTRLCHRRDIRVHNLDDEALP